MKRINLSLWIGLLICSVLLVFMAFPESLAARSPYTITTMRSWVEDGSARFERAPFPPSADYVLGTDEHGRDIWAHILYGTRLTMTLGILIVLGRFLIAIPIAMAAGFGNALAGSMIKQFGLLFSAIPALLVSIIVLRQDLFASLEKNQSIAAFVVVLSLVGWAKLGNLVMERTQAIVHQPFIRSEVAIGKRRFHIATQNVIPHLASELVVLFFMEIARVLSLIMQLGIFGVFVGNLRIIKDTQSGVITVFNISFEPEWASMLGTAESRIHSAPWMILFPALAFFISVLGFNLLGEGVRAKLQESDSGFVPALRRLIQFDLLSLWRTATRASRIRVAVMVAALLLVVFLPTALQGNRYRFETDGQLDQFPERSLLGTRAGWQVAGVIANRMKDLGLQTLGGDSYFFDYQVVSASVPTEHQVLLRSDTGVTPAQIGEDFSFVALGSIEQTGEIYDATRDDLLNVADYTLFNDRFVLVDKSYYSEGSIRYITDTMWENSTVKGLLLIARDDEPLPVSIGEGVSDRFVLLVSRRFAGLLLESVSPEITVAATAELLGNTGRNVGGILPGTDPGVGDEALLIGMGYNYTEPAGSRALLFNLELMERLCSEMENRRSVIFFFLDGTLKDEHHGIRAVMEGISYNATDIEVYLDLTGVRSGPIESVVWSTAQAPITRYYAWSFGRLLEEQLGSRRLPQARIQAVNRGGEYYFPDSEAANQMFWGHGVATIRVGTESGTAPGRHLDDLGDVLVRTIGMNNY